MDDTITEAVRALHLAILRGREGEAAASARLLARLSAAARPVTLPAPMEARHA